MKHFVLLLLSLLSTMAVSAQTTLVATLTHAGEVKSFYSANALKDAYAAAEDGDIITLSAGTFAATDFKTKKVTVRGAGMMEYPTVITGSIRIAIENTETNENVPFVLEGIRFLSTVTLNPLFNATISKCSFDSYLYAYKGSNIQFVHDFFKYAIFTSTGSGLFANCINCFFEDGDVYTNTDILVSFTNCTFDTQSYVIWTRGASYTNCLIVDRSSSDNHYFNQGVDALGCTYIGNSKNVYLHTQKRGNKSFPADTPVFKEDSETYELLDENASAWLGLDGTQVGIHGGSLPFDPATNNPKITKFNVAPKTTADGKLSVDIEIQAL